MAQAAVGLVDNKLLAPSRPSTNKPELTGDSIDLPRAMSRDERYAAGRALRSASPRKGQARWKRRDLRTDPLELLRTADAERLPELIPIRYGRMLASPLAFYRGSAGVMASDLATTPKSGFIVQACGDCHLMNFGGFATPERNILFDINDFDETLPAPWEWDLKRLVASIVLAARANGIPDSKGREAAVACARNYRKQIASFSKMHPLDVWYAKVLATDVLDLCPPRERDRIEKRIQKITSEDAAEADFPKLTKIVAGRLGIRDAPPLIFHPDLSRSPEFAEQLKQVLGDYRDTLTDDRRILLDRYDLVDAALKVVGVGSVGRRCWIALFMSASNDPLFLQFKEAAPSVLEPVAGASSFSHNGKRIVMGQRLMQPASDVFLGWVTDAKTGRQFYVRQLRDAKIKPLVELFDDTLMQIYARACGWVLARAHAKGGDPAIISGYLGSSDLFDEAMGAFAVSYADQAEKDHAALKAAVKNGRIEAFQES